MVAYLKPQPKKKEESERLSGEESDQVIYFRFERWQVVRFRKARRRQYDLAVSTVFSYSNYLLYSKQIA